MPRPLGKIRLMLSARVVLDLEEADAIFKKDPAEYADYMRARGQYADAYDATVSGRKISKGPLFNFVQTALSLNKDPANPVIEVCVICKDNGETALPIFRSLDVHGLGAVEMRYALSGHSLTKAHHDAFGTDFFLTRNAADAQNAVDLGIAAAAVNFPPNGLAYELTDCKQLKLCFDGDAVTFGSSAERYYREKGVDIYKAYEGKNFDKHIEPGPFTALLQKMTEVNHSVTDGEAPFELSLLTARGGLASARVLTVAEKFGIDFNGQLLFLAGAAKKDPLLHLKWHMFFDDQQTHLEHAMEHCATGLVPYQTGSAMDKYQKAQARKATTNPTAVAFNKESAPEKTETTAANQNKRNPRNSRNSNPKND